jgi:hypothetical protein
MVEVVLMDDSDDNASEAVPPRFTGEVICIVQSSRGAGVIRFDNGETAIMSTYWAQCLSEGQWISCQLKNTPEGLTAYAIRLLLRRDVLIADRNAHGGGRKSGPRTPPRSPGGSRRRRSSRRGITGLTITGVGLSAAAAGAEDIRVTYTGDEISSSGSRVLPLFQTANSWAVFSDIKNMVCRPVDPVTTAALIEYQQPDVAVNLGATLSLAGTCGLDYIGARDLERNAECMKTVQNLVCRPVDILTTAALTKNQQSYAAASPRKGGVVLGGHGRA